MGTGKNPKEDEEVELCLAVVHSRIIVINTFLIPYITFYSPILSISQRNWKAFLQLIKSSFGGTRLVRQSHGNGGSGSIVPCEDH